MGEEGHGGLGGQSICLGMGRTAWAKVEFAWAWEGLLGLR